MRDTDRSRWAPNIAYLTIGALIGWLASDVMTTGDVSDQSARRVDEIDSKLAALEARVSAVQATESTNQLAELIEERLVALLEDGKRLADFSDRIKSELRRDFDRQHRALINVMDNDMNALAAETRNRIADLIGTIYGEIRRVEKLVSKNKRQPD